MTTISLEAFALNKTITFIIYSHRLIQKYDNEISKIRNVTAIFTYETTRPPSDISVGMSLS